MVAAGEFFFWLGASAERTGLGSAEAPEPDKQSPPYGCHPSRCDHSSGWAYSDTCERSVSGECYTCSVCGEERYP